MIVLNLTIYSLKWEPGHIMIFIHFTISKVDENHNAHTHTPILKIGVCVFVLTGTDWENVFAVPTGVPNSIEKASNII